MEYDATITRIFGMPPYGFFAMIGIVFAASLFILLLLKYNYSIPLYKRILFLSGGGLLIGAKLFGCLSGLYSALANSEPITLKMFIYSGIVYYGGLFGFIASFLIICKKKAGEIDFGVMDLLAVCIPLFLFWGRIGCFFAGCCYGVETNSWFSVLYTTRIDKEIVTASRVPIQLVESFLSLVIFFAMLILLNRGKFREKLIIVYLLIYAPIRIFLEFFRGDLVRGVWNGISFSQVISLLIIVYCIPLLITNKAKGKEICQTFGKSL